MLKCFYMMNATDYELVKIINPTLQCAPLECQNVCAWLATASFGWSFISYIHFITLWLVYLHTKITTTLTYQCEMYINFINPVVFNIHNLVYYMYNDNCCIKYLVKQ